MTGPDLEQVRAALALADFDVVAAQRLMSPLPRALPPTGQRSSPARQASVLILLYPTEAGLALVLNRRSANPHDVHSGQIGLPGGAQEPGEALLETALRETYEELGITLPVQIMGSLSCLYIPPSNFEIYPFVGYLPARPLWQPDPKEVAEVLECPLIWLLDKDRKVIEEWDWNGSKINVPWYAVQGHKVWGATAIILSEFEQRLRQILGQ